MSHRRFRLAAVAAVALALTACAPQPEPSSTPTGFASEEEAYAAAEETYRAYVDALNSVDLSEPSTFEPLYEQLTGEASSGARTEFSDMHAMGWSLDGDALATLVDPIDFDASTGNVRLAVCLDVSRVEARDAQGNSVVGEDRRALQAMLVTLIAPDPPDPKYLITTIDGREGAPACSDQ